MISIPWSIKKNPVFVEITFYNLPDRLKKRNDFKLDRERNYKFESDMRSKRMIIDYALNNTWDYFFTITLDKNKVGDRTAVKKQITKLLEHFKYTKKKIDSEFKYILVVEPHKRKEDNGKQAVHFHGLVKLNDNFKENNPLDFPTSLDGSFRHKSYRDKYDNVIAYCESNRIKKSFGINTFTRIYNNQEFLSYYIAKYINKLTLADIETSQRYYKSKGLKKSDVQVFDDWSKFDIDFTYKYIRNGLEPSYIGQFAEKYKVTHAQFEQMKEVIGDFEEYF